ncbi:hypothetical protein AYK25_05630 [Thermoplasmatales archaeon SM1-50]|nr:MAG: hypothetical protein AYK25_05630 [Thermoplasmatales archaeon SM1-50]
MKKCVSIVVVGMVILCGITAGALPLNFVDTLGEKTPQTSCQLPTNTTNLTIIIKGGIGVTVIFTNTGEFDAIDVTTEIDITNAPFHFYSVGSGAIYYGSLSPGKSYRQRLFDIGIGKITVNVTASADNVAQVTKTAEGTILLFFIILK